MKSKLHIFDCGSYQNTKDPIFNTLRRSTGTRNFFTQELLVAFPSSDNF